MDGQMDGWTDGWMDGWMDAVQYWNLTEKKPQQILFQKAVQAIANMLHYSLLSDKIVVISLILEQAFNPLYTNGFFLQV